MVHICKEELNHADTDDQAIASDKSDPAKETSAGQFGEDTLKREDDPRKGHHSFWPESYPENVSQILESDKEAAERARIRENDNDENDKFRVTPASRRFLPCHYFDYICGSSTGA
jgi:hypothetical protein